MGNEAEKDSVALSFIRAIGAGILPSQPRYVTGLQAYADILSKYEKEEGDGASELFLEDYPEYFMLVDQLTDSTSGLHSDETAVNLVKNHKDTVELLVATVGEKNLGVLGAVFNDADYAFSSAANAYLVANAIPGTREKFKKQGAALENSRSSIVSEGWRKWSSLIEIVSQEVAANGYSTSSGYGAAIIKNYKEAYMQKAKTDNPIWYSEKKSPSFSEKGNPTIAALTIAANTPALWKELSKQPRWHTIVEYLNFRYDVYDELKRRGVTLANAGDIEVKAAAFVAKLRKEDITFGRYYDRYFDGDTFDDPTLEK
jgi:hypothetical protein